MCGCVATGSQGAVGRTEPLALINFFLVGDYEDANWLSVCGMMGPAAQPQ